MRSCYHKVISHTVLLLPSTLPSDNLVGITAGLTYQFSAFLKATFLLCHLPNEVRAAAKVLTGGCGNLLRVLQPTLDQELQTPVKLLQ